MKRQNTVSSSSNLIVFVLVNFVMVRPLNPIHTVFSKYCSLVEENQIYSQLPLCQLPIYLIPFVPHRGSLQSCHTLYSCGLPQPFVCSYLLRGQTTSPSALSWLALFTLIYSVSLGTFCVSYNRGVLSTSRFESLMENLCRARGQQRIRESLCC